MRATARVVAVATPRGGTALTTLRSQPPLVLRRCGDEVRLVAAAAGPLGGDDLQLDVTVDAGARLRLAGVAATVAQPARVPAESVMRTTVEVGAGGACTLLPEPLVVADGARHTTTTVVALAAGARLVLREEALLGRHGERGGRLRARLDVTYDGLPLLRQSLELDGEEPDTGGAAVLAGARAVGSLLVVDPEWADPARRPAAWSGAGVAVLPLDGPGVLVTALAADALTLRRRLDTAARRMPPVDASGSDLAGVA